MPGAAHDHPIKTPVRRTLLKIGKTTALSDPHDEAVAWNNLGAALRELGEVERAVEAGERAVALFEDLGDRYRLGEALDELADSLLAGGCPAAVVRARREASVAAYRRAGAEEEAVKVLEKMDE